jgi:hypothetical protein
LQLQHLLRLLKQIPVLPLHENINYRTFLGRGTSHQRGVQGELRQAVEKSDLKKRKFTFIGLILIENIGYIFL